MFLGLVAAGTTPSVATGATTRSLDDELAARGITPLPMDLVKAYMKRMVKETKSADRPYPVWYRVGVGDIGVLNPPRSVRETVDKARAIPGAKVYAYAFDDDPFVFIARGKGEGIRQVRCIRSWNNEFQA